MKIPKHISNNLVWILFIGELGILVILLWVAMCLIDRCWIGLLGFAGWLFVVYFMKKDIDYEARKAKFVKEYFKEDKK